MAVDSAHAARARLRQGSPVVGRPHSLLGLPRDALAVGDNTSQQGAAVVAAQAYQHDAVRWQGREMVWGLGFRVYGL